MAFDWRDFFLFAHELRSERDESKQRTSIGRAYYYAYHAALNEAKKLGFKPDAPSLKRMGTHQRLWNWFLSQTTNQDLINLGDSGNTLKGRRTSVDYYLIPSPSPQLVQQHLDETRGFELLLSQIAGREPPPPLP